METVEAGPGTVCRVTPSGCERRPGRSNGGQRSWSLAAGGLARAQPRIAQCLLRLARDSTIDCETYRLTRRTAGCGPACPVVWEGRSCEASPYPDQLSAARGPQKTDFCVPESGQYHDLRFPRGLACRRQFDVERVGGDHPKPPFSAHVDLRAVSGLLIPKRKAHVSNVFDRLAVELH